ncbi:hypothetical protein LIER_22755 [Lithospermum erythrorhizon]|uniref:Uncharacterized protein n=1 Tax=Lithospermum erythrorhizon TaxID=34254 RepID=A0AAV3QXA1_LITER
MTPNSNNGSKPDLSKLEPLDGKIINVGLKSSSPIDAIIKKNEEDIEKYDKDNRTARYLILNDMVDNLFNLYKIHKSAKLICETLEIETGGPSNVNRFKGKAKVDQKKWQSKKSSQNKFTKPDAKIQKNVNLLCF